MHRHDRPEEGNEKIMELEEELKATREDYEEKIVVLVEKNDDLTRKLGVFMGDPAQKDNQPGDYIILDDTDSDPDSDDDYVDEAGADIMESSSDENF